jgi:lambda family phage portal protein
VNLVGPDGIKLQLKIGDYNAKGQFVPDNYSNRLITAKWEDFCKKENCCVDEQTSFWDLQNLVSDHLGRDGEFFIRIVKSSSAKYGIKLQVIEPDLINEKVNMLADVQDRTIRMGIEIDQWRRVTGYYITKMRPGLDIYYTSQYSFDFDRVDASEMIHGYDRARAFQTRGLPFMTPVMIRMKMLSGYEEAALVNARASAGKMGFFYSESGETYSGNDSDDQGNIISSISPGDFEQLPPGVKFASHDPKYPDAQHESFATTILEGISSGLGVAYESLTNNFSRTSFSSARTSLQNERDSWKREQNWMMETIYNPLFAIWLENAYMSGAFANAAGNSLPIMSKWDRFNSPSWIGRRWDWVDPLKDTQTAILKIRAGLATATGTLSEQGKDISEVYSELESEKQLATDHNLTLEIDSQNLTAASTMKPDANAGTPAAEGQGTPDKPQKETKKTMAAKSIKQLFTTDELMKIMSNGEDE